MAWRVTDDENTPPPPHTRSGKVDIAALRAFAEDKLRGLKLPSQLSDEALDGLPWTSREAIVKAKLGSDAEWSSTFGQLSRDKVDVLARVAREVLKPQASNLYS